MTYQRSTTNDTSNVSHVNRIWTLSGRLPATSQQPSVPAVYPTLIKLTLKYRVSRTSNVCGLRHPYIGWPSVSPSWLLCCTHLHSPMSSVLYLLYLGFGVLKSQPTEDLRQARAFGLRRQVNGALLATVTAHPGPDLWIYKASG